MFGTRIPGSRAFAALALGALVLTGCGGDSVESYEDAEENYLVGCLEPFDGQPAQFEDGELVRTGEDADEKYPNEAECRAMWDAIQAELSFEDFKLVSEAIDNEPDLLTLDEVPVDLVSEEEQDRLEDAVAVLQDIASAPTGNA